MSVMDQIKSRAKANKKRIVLAEGMDERVVRAAAEATKISLADIVLLGDPDAIAKFGVDLTGVTIVNPLTSKKAVDYAEGLYELRKAKGMTLEKAREMVKNELYFGTMMIKMEDADGMVAGAVNSTPDVLRPALQIIKARKGLSVVSSCFVIEIPDKSYGHEGAFIYSDCGVNPNPDANQLATIAASAAESARLLIGMDPRIAMLSFSTKGSAQHELVDKMQEATRLAKEQFPDLVIDGELQVDAALVPEVQKQKAPGSPLGGRANVLIFPDLQAGNIAYKLTQRLAHGIAIGPIIQGLARPVNDLSRGCNVEDIVCGIAITSVQAQA
jgi:phosphate acetyltransferase